MVNLAAKYAAMHREYLQIQHPAMFQELEEKGELESRVAEIGRDAEQVYHAMIKQMTARYQEMRADRPGKETYLSQMPLTADEIVRNEVVYAL